MVKFISWELKKKKRGRKDINHWGVWDYKNDV